MTRSIADRMDSFPIPDAALSRHIAVLGETGSGKTHDAKVVVEHLVGENYRVCVLDTIKSDWWGMISSASGKRAGLPFRIIGGPRGHVPLHAGAGKAIGELVGRGKLPLSIIDMADFDAGEPQEFFQDFAKALWRSMKGVLYLVIEEAHELAPKERAGFGNENMAVYWAKKLATGSRTKGIRLIIASQRTQAVHNALLGSCGTMIAHSLTLPADQKPVREWLDANILDKGLTSTIKDELAFLPTGTAWVCCAKERFFEKIAFPEIATFDNSATPDKDAEDFEVATAAVDHDELRAIIGEAVKEAEANDPKKLRAEVDRLTKALAAKAVPAPVVHINTDEIEATAEQRGFERGKENGWQRGFPAGQQDGFEKAKDTFGAFLDATTFVASTIPDDPHAGAPPPQVVPLRAPVAQRSEHRVSNARTTGSTPAGRSNPEQRILDGLRELELLGVPAAPRVLASFMAGYAHIRSKGFVNALGALRSGGAVAYPDAGTVSLTAIGRAQAAHPVAVLTTEDVQRRIVSMLGGASGEILAPLVKYYPRALSREDVAIRAGYGHLRSKGFVNALGRLRTLGFVEYPNSGTVAATRLLFPEVP